MKVTPPKLAKPDDPIFKRGLTFFTPAPRPLIKVSQTGANQESSVAISPEMETRGSGSPTAKELDMKVIPTRSASRDDPIYKGGLQFFTPVSRLLAKPSLSSDEANAIPGTSEKLEGDTAPIAPDEQGTTNDR